MVPEKELPLNKNWPQKPDFEVKSKGIEKILDYYTNNQSDENLLKNLRNGQSNKTN